VEAADAARQRCYHAKARVCSNLKFVDPATVRIVTAENPVSVWTGNSIEYNASRLALGKDA
jgi:hypothetical protein